MAVDLFAHHDVNAHEVQTPYSKNESVPPAVICFPTEYCLTISYKADCKREVRYPSLSHDLYLFHRTSPCNGYNNNFRCCTAKGVQICVLREVNKRDYFQIMKPTSEIIT